MTTTRAQRSDHYAYVELVALDHLGRRILLVVVCLVVLVPLEARVHAVEEARLTRPVLVLPPIRLGRNVAARQTSYLCPRSLYKTEGLHGRCLKAPCPRAVLYCAVLQPTGPSIIHTLLDTSTCTPNSASPWSIPRARSRATLESPVCSNRITRRQHQPIQSALRQQRMQRSNSHSAATYGVVGCHGDNTLRILRHLISKHSLPLRVLNRECAKCVHSRPTNQSGHP
jgi:hypothetical protein